MSLDLDFLDYCLDQLSFTDSLSFRKMFGGAGLYADQVMFGLVSGDRLYFRTDLETAPRYLEAQMDPFVPFADKPHYKMPYHEVPLSILEQPSELQSWVVEAVRTALKYKKKPKTSKLLPAQ